MGTVKMKNIMLIMAMGVAINLFAVTVGPEWCVAYPDDQDQEVNRALKIAAEEMRDDINEAAGLQIKAVPYSAANPHAIYIGAEPARKAGFDLSGLKWYDNVIAEKDGNVYLFGRDRLGRKPDPVKYKRGIGWIRCVLPSVRATTRFLETFAGVRFLMPGEVGKEVPKCETLSVPDGTLSKEQMSSIVYHTTSTMIFGGFRYNNGQDGREMIYFIANGIWGMGPFHSYGGHTYPYACPASKYSKNHPEYFGVRNGKPLLGLPSSETPLCISNPKVEDLIVEELKKRFDEGVYVCQLAQQDGGIDCECEKCRAMFGTGDDWCEKYWLFHRRIAERILRERPGRIVHILNYGQTAAPPKSFKVFPANVMIEMCKYSDEAFRKWREYTVPHGFTVYTYLCGNYLLPGYVARHSFAYIAQLAKQFRDNNVRGLYRCGGEGDLFGTEGPCYYIFHKLLLDGSHNVGELISDYCRAAYGPAADQMHRFYEIQDSRLRMFDKINVSYPVAGVHGIEPYVNARPKKALDLHGWMFSPDTTAAMEECLERAEKTTGLSAKHRKRLELVRLEFDYAKTMGAISTLYSAYRLRPTKESLLPLLDVVESRNAYLDRLFGEKWPRRLKGWPELQPFGIHESTRPQMNVNGATWSSAAIGAPLTWPVELLRKSAGILPGKSVKETFVAKVHAPQTFADFESKSGWNELGGMSMGPAPVKARFKAVYDEHNLYILNEREFAVGVTPKKIRRDGAVWSDDCADILIAPGDTRDVYYHLLYGVDPESRYDDATGLVTDPLNPNYGRADVSWNGKGWETQSRLEGGKWQSIVKLPYSDFRAVAPKPGDKWFFNIGHTIKIGEKKERETYAIWSPNTESLSFIAPNAMGKLIFR